MKYTITYRYDEARNECVAAAHDKDGVGIALETSEQSFADAKLKLVQVLGKIKQKKTPKTAPPKEEIDI